MANVTREQAVQLMGEINTIAPGTANIQGGSEGLRLKVTARIAHPATGNSAVWVSSYADTIPSAEEIVADLRKQLGIRAKRTRAAIRSERGGS